MNKIDEHIMKQKIKTSKCGNCKNWSDFKAGGYSYSQWRICTFDLEKRIQEYRELGGSGTSFYAKIHDFLPAVKKSGYCLNFRRKFT